MAIEFVCPACGGTLQVGDESAGRVIRCGACLTALRVPEADAARVPAPAPTNPEPSAAAVPVEPRRRRDRDDPYDDRPRRRRGPDDPYDDRPRRRRSPPPSAGYGVFFWLVVVGAVMLVGVIGCCGALFLALPGAKWQEHESKDGGFRIEAPGKVQRDAGKAAGIQLEKGTHSEGTVLVKRAEQFFVFYRDVPSTKDRAGKFPPETDERLIKQEIDAVRAATQGGEPAVSKPVTVDGFDGREVEFFGKSGWYTARVIVADTRVYVLLAGGGMAKPGDPDVRRFIDTFKITRPELVAEGKRREEQAKMAADAAKEAKEREARRKAEAEEEDLHDAAEAAAEASMTAATGAALARREAEKVRSAAEVVAGAAVGVGLSEAAAPRPPVAPPPRPVED